jgi:transcriptional regulator with GAF, ATPase, and Fis domain
VVNEYNRQIIKAQQIIEDQQRFEQLITDIASKTAQTKPDQLEAKMNGVLRILGQFFNVRLAFLAQFSKNLNKLHFTNIWVADGKHPITCTYVIDSAAKIPKPGQHVRDDELIRPDTDQIGLLNEKPLSQMLESHGISDGMVVPIFVEGKLFGLLGLGSFTRPCKYPLANADRLQIIADMIGPMLSRSYRRTLS